MNRYTSAGSDGVGARRLAAASRAPRRLRPKAVPTKAGQTRDFNQPELEIVAGQSQATQGNADPTSDRAA